MLMYLINDCSVFIAGYSVNGLLVSIYMTCTILSNVLLHTFNPFLVLVITMYIEFCNII